MDWITGDLSGRTSGGAVHAILPQPILGPVQLETSGGTLTVRVAAEAAFELDARTTGGRCVSDVTLTQLLSDPRDHAVLRGSVGRQGPPLHLRNSGGGIQIKRIGESP